MREITTLYDKVVISITKKEQILYTDTPIFIYNNKLYIEFTVWANKIFGSDLEVLGAYNPPHWNQPILRIYTKSFTEKSASALKAAGFKEYSISVEEEYGEYGEPTGHYLLLIIIPLVEPIK